MEARTPQFTNLIEVTTHFSDKKVCKEYLARMRWDGKPECPYCQSKKCGQLKGKYVRYKCYAKGCRKQFSEIKGTIFENSPISLQKWFVAIWLFTSHKKGISSVQLGKDIGVTQKTAWFMNHRIRKAMETKSFNKPLKGTVQVDETYIGGDLKNKHAKDKKNKGARGMVGKTPVIGMVESGGKVIAMKMDKPSQKTIKPILEKHISKDATLVTDGFGGYTGSDRYFKKHVTIQHSQGQYVKEIYHTNTIEGFWSLLKRGIVGIYHSVSVEHLDA